jgi:hypothetical protein
MAIAAEAREFGLSNRETSAGDEKRDPRPIVRHEVAGTIFRMNRQKNLRGGILTGKFREKKEYCSGRWAVQH